MHQELCLFLERFDIVKLPIDRCKTKIGNLVYFLEFGHDKLADQLALDFWPLRMEFSFDFVGYLVEDIHTDGALAAGAHHAELDLVAVKGFFASITLDDLEFAIAPLVSGKAFLTFGALSPAAHGDRGIIFPRINNLRLSSRAIWTQHLFSPRPSLLTSHTTLYVV